MRSTLEQVGAVGEVALERARSSRGRLDNVMLERRRRDALARLGEAVYIAAMRGELGGFGDRPDIADLLADVEDVQERLEHSFDSEEGFDIRLGDNFDGRDDGAVSSANWRPPPVRERADDDEPLRVWRPIMPAGDSPAADSQHRDDNDGDGATDQHDSAAVAPRSIREDETSARPAFDAATAEPAEPQPAPHDDAESAARSALASLAAIPGLGELAEFAAQAMGERADATDESSARSEPDPSRRRGRGRRGRARRTDSERRGGIAFVSDSIDPDDDLSEYMHEDDLPTTDSDAGE